jgi:hypothetical protein
VRRGLAGYGVAQRDRRGSGGSARLGRCGVAQIGCDVAQSGAEWPSRAQFGLVKKGVGLLPRLNIE